MTTSAGRHILICERDRELSGALRYLLEDEGYVVTVVESVDDGVTVLRASQDGLIVVWDATPGVGGLELLSAVLDDDVAPARHAYVLLTTGSIAQLRDLTRMLPTLRMAVVPMPFGLQTLLRTVALAAVRLAGGVPAMLRAIS
jgi:DNA-binding response OmpR family regulator